MKDFEGLNVIIPYVARWWAEISAARRAVQLAPVFIALDETDTAFSFSRMELRTKYARLKVCCGS